jgi:hypothetical protein
MKLIVRTITEFGPRTTVTQGLAAVDAYALAKAHTAQEGHEAHIVEDGEVINMVEYIKANRGKPRGSIMHLAGMDLSEPMRRTLSNVLVKLERPRRVRNGEPK